ncbi:MAG TPA: single-stranded DNA-binding protein [Tepidisphaeraceae bacterium]|nr:single-stranded DNA-binding protein [Tepidisphaeraceae bacterium]
MASFNKVLLMGNLTRDPQLKYLPSQTAVAEFGLACNRKFRTANGEDREEVTFVDVTAFGKQAEVINQYCQKGKALFIEGRLKYDTWDDKNGGGKRSKLTVVIENFQFVGGRDGAEGGGGGGGFNRSNYAGGDDENGGGGGGGGGNGGGYNQRPQQNRGPQRQPANRGPQGGGQQQRPAPEQPFGDEQQFKEDDIPF